MASVAKKLATVNGVLYQMRKTLPKSLRIAVFNALIQSHLSYGISVWGCGGDSNRLKKVFIAQKKAIRNAFGVRRVNKDIPGNTKIVFNNNTIPTVRNVYTKSIVSEACQLMNNPNHPVLLSEHFSKSLINSNVFIIILLKVTIVTIEIISFIPSLVYGMLLSQLTSFDVISAIWLRLKRQLKNSNLIFKVMAIQTSEF